jgi:hypothetical protein
MRSATTASPARTAAFWTDGPVSPAYEETAKIARWLQADIEQLGRDHAELGRERARLRGERERLHGLI